MYPLIIEGLKIPRPIIKYQYQIRKVWCCDSALCSCFVGRKVPEEFMSCRVPLLSRLIGCSLQSVLRSKYVFVIRDVCVCVRSDKHR